uniref:Keratin-associated protein 21-1-like n=1 Tax=Elaeophora elaphi TaxID=1147741 RepID=A0A0R3RMA6_9BILA
MYLTEISEDERIHRVKRQCGCCSCYDSGPSSCACSSSCPCAPDSSHNTPYQGGYGNMGYGNSGISFNGDSGFGFNPYRIMFGQYNSPAYGMNYNMGNGCGFDGTATAAACSTGSAFPYNFGGGYSGGYGGGFATGNTGYIYPQVTGCSTAFNTRCYCGSGYSPCNNGALCCKNGIGSPMIR